MASDSVHASFRLKNDQAKSEQVKQALRWVQAVLGGEELPEDFVGALKSGVILCRLVNAIFPGSCSQYNNSVIPFMQMENMVIFLRAAEKLGLHKNDLFMATDLYHGKNIPAVTNCLEALHRLAKEKGWRGPNWSDPIAKSQGPDGEEDSEEEIVYGAPPPAEPQLLQQFLAHKAPSTEELEPPKSPMEEENAPLVHSLSKGHDEALDLEALQSALVEEESSSAEPMPIPVKVERLPEPAEMAAVSGWAELLSEAKKSSVSEGGASEAPSNLQPETVQALESVQSELARVTQQQEAHAQRPRVRRRRHSRPRNPVIADTYQRLTGTINNHKTRVGLMVNDEPTFVDYSGKRFNANLAVEVENGELVVRAGSLVSLVQCVADRDIPDNKYIHDFFATYDYFMDSLEVLDCLLDRFAYLPPKHADRSTRKDFDKWRPYLQLRVQNALIYWVDEHFHYFARDKEFREKFQVALLAKVGIGSTKRGLMLKEMYLMKVKEFLANSDHAEDSVVYGDAAPVLLSAFPTATLRRPRRLGKQRSQLHVTSYTDLTFTKIPPIDLAHQLVLLEKEFFDRIQPSEFKTQNWRKPEKGTLSPNVVLMIEWFNKITYWVGMEIVTTSNVKERAAVLQRFLDIAAELRRLNAFNTLMEIVSGLNQVCIKRLKRTWKLIPRKDLEAFEETQILMSARANYRIYRAYLAEIQQKIAFGQKIPVLPYIGVFIQDLTLVEELPNQIEVEGQTMVNFKKMRRIAHIISEVRTLQRLEYNLPSSRTIAEWLVYGAQPLSEVDLYKFSKLCEPN